MQITNTHPFFFYVPRTYSHTRTLVFRLAMAEGWTAPPSGKPVSLFHFYSSCSYFSDPAGFRGTYHSDRNADGSQNQAEKNRVKEARGCVCGGMLGQGERGPCFPGPNLIDHQWSMIHGGPRLGSNPLGSGGGCYLWNSNVGNL